MTPADKPEPVAWMYERKPEEWPPAAPVVQLTRWAEDDLARPFWTETPLYTRPTSDLAERIEGLVEPVARAISGAPFPSEASKRKASAAIAVILAALKEVGHADNGD
jgi:hypothetical protein